MIKTDIRQLSEAELDQWFTDRGHNLFRARQVRKWLWEKQCTEIEEMTDLPKNLRDELNSQFQIPSLVTDFQQQSNDGTIKSRFLLQDGNKIESVLIPVTTDNRYTLCVSTQVGCSLTCKFCATGRMGRIRNLNFTEIFDQVAIVNRQSQEIFGHRLTNIVYMGMGEPLLNYANTLQSIHKITSPQGMGMSPSRITISTAGIAKMIRKLADDGSKTNLALSLHAANDKKRNDIMPINDQNNIAVLMDALEYYYNKTRNRITYEYLALKDFNDSKLDAIELSQLTKRFPVRVNIIEYNPVSGIAFERTEESKLHIFLRTLVDHGVNVTLRRSRGKDIDAACGQLANKNIE